MKAPPSARHLNHDADHLRTLLVKTQAGNVDALGELFAEHGAMVYRAAYGLTRQRADAEDVAQDVFLRLPGALAGFTGTTSQFPAWLRRVAVRQSLMQLRAGRRRNEVNVEALAGLLARPDGTPERLTLAAALERLSPEHRTVFLLKEVEGYDHTEIGELLGISASTSEVRLHRARRHLRSLLQASR